MVILPNIRFDTLRVGNNPVTQQSLGASPYLSKIMGHVAATSSKQLAALPEAAFGTEYYVIVDTGTQIAEGDVLVNLIRLSNGQTWPGNVIQQGNANAPIIIWRVKLILEESAGLMDYRKVFLVRQQLSGPAGN